MKIKILMTCLLAGCAAAPGSGSTSFALLPPPFLKVRVTRVEVPGVCIGPLPDYFLYVSHNGVDHSALIVDTDGMTRYRDVPVRAEKCDDSSLAWPDQAVGIVKEGTSPTGQLLPQLIVTTPSMNSCHLAVDLPLTAGYACSPPGMRHPE